MARCKKSYEDQLKAVEEQIAKVQEKLNHLKEQRENIPVSYTHLDVYKRQV